MVLPGLIDSQITNGSFFDVAQYKEILNKREYGEHLMPFVLFSNLMYENIDTHLLDQIEGEKLNLKKDTYLLLTKLPEKIWSDLPIQSHELLTPTEEQVKELTLALDHLTNHYPSGAKLFSEFAKTVAWVKLKEEFKGQDSQITSSSFPVLPLCVFISDKALHHVPPNSISQEPSYRFLAENLYHEAVHQAVNMNLLLHEIFIEDYNSSESPKVEIPWRYNQVQRNQYWELDRTFHATIVYSQVIQYRLAQLDDSKLKPFERKAFEEATRAGIDAATYLSQSLLINKQYFTKKGAQLIEDLAFEIKKVSQKVSNVKILK